MKATVGSGGARVGEGAGVGLLGMEGLRCAGEGQQGCASD